MNPPFGVPRLRGPDRLKAELQTRSRAERFMVREQFKMEREATDEQVHLSFVICDSQLFIRGLAWAEKVRWPIF